MSADADAAQLRQILEQVEQCTRYLVGLGSMSAATLGVTALLLSRTSLYAGVAILALLILTAAAAGASHLAAERRRWRAEVQRLRRAILAAGYQVRVLGTEVHIRSATSGWRIVPNGRIPSVLKVEDAARRSG
ncbi:hypothetical protein [Indioceanicola profundi]|uniref:hypothetical protein n=1 Tax=Indioceanicola profundi TaxID=2220096 RepID=UPI000E6AA301|nr:hypothetical protein [Indioceanicola profundi]